MKYGRNDKCWCGSGIKYKKCHMNRKDEEPLKPYEVTQEFRQAFSSKYCLAPKNMQPHCSGQIIKAHTIPKRGSLNKISENGHVYSIKPSIEKLISSGGLFEPEPVGVNIASTFTGFCSLHDNAIFKNIEDIPFIGTNEQCFLLGYRAISRELFMKISAIEINTRMRGKIDRGKDPKGQIYINDMITASRIGLDAGLRDLKYHKSEFDKILSSKNFSTVKSYQIYIDGPPPVMASGCIMPEYDFEGNNIQELGDVEKILSIISYSSFYGDNMGAIVFSWLPQSDEKCRRFINSLIKVSDQDLADSIMRFQFEYFENLCISPAWWVPLDANIKKAIKMRMVASCRPEIGRSNNCLLNDGITYDSWIIKDKKLVV